MTCTTPDCTDAVFILVTSECKRHYSQRKAEEAKARDKCSHPGCNRLAVANKLLCYGHDSRPECTHQGCTRAQRNSTALGECNIHHHARLRNERKASLRGDAAPRKPRLRRQERAADTPSYLNQLWAEFGVEHLRSDA